MNRLFYLLFGLNTLLLCACSKTELPQSQNGSAVYYWKTTFKPDSADINFMQRHDVDRIYLRLFDVDEEFNNYKPVATLSFPDSIPVPASLDSTEFVPTVFITVDALRLSESKSKDLANKIVERVKNMCSYNSIPNVSELQLDCDWTESTDKLYFALCDSVKSCMRRHGLDWKLSSTIRLHQLAQTPPPVDSGVLMLYNTGNYDDFSADNSILSADDVRPYMKHLAQYPLPLDIAYPVYSWQLLFRDKQFVGLINGVDVADTTKFKRIDNTRFQAKGLVALDRITLHAGDIIRREYSEIATILEVKQMIERELKGRAHRNIIYHLDSKKLSNYTDNEISQIFAYPSDN